MSGYGVVEMTRVEGRDEPLVHYLGTDIVGQPVHYQITGWEPREKALIIYRADVMP